MLLHRHVARSHSPQIVHQAEHAGIAHRQPFGIRHRQRKSRTLQQVAGGADVDLRVQPRNGAILLGKTQRVAKRCQAAGTRKSGEQQPVWLQHAADECKRAGHIIDLVEDARANYKIKACIGEWQAVFVGLYPRGSARKRKACVTPHNAGSRELKRCVVAAKIKRDRKFPLHARQPLVHLIKHEPAQKIRLVIVGRCPVAAHPAQRPAEDFGRRHQRACAVPAPARQAAMQLPAGVRMLVDMVLPPRCPGCGAVTRADHQFCAGCWASLQFLAPPWCAACQAPFAYEREGGALCAPCMAHPPRHSGILAAVAYGDVARSLVLRLKYGKRTALATTAAAHMLRLMPADADLLVPVPLHRWRLWARGFNQAALMAAALAGLTGVAHDPLVLRRTRRTRPLEGLGAAARARTVAGVFAVHAPHARRLAGKAIILVDDVHTSGATSRACTAALLSAGARKVTILCWARVLSDAQKD